MKQSLLTYAFFLTFAPSLVFAQLVNKDDTTKRNYFHEDGSIRIAIAVQSHRPWSDGKNALDGPSPSII